ncbi:MAG: hypothetical protein M1587_08010 [Thaumarchaeota archaeon]|nr:hypothetical protein [Nitrososphaerota archaeon]MCL5068367.1 hypothetical protein [Nitrososphaerota archaeon]MDG6907458.1 hypothetical protein [Nitrososphaerota archaeon]
MNDGADPNKLMRKSPTKRSLATFFAIGGMMLVLPLALVLATNPVCTPNTETICSTSSAYKFVLSFFPYVMLAGGLIIGYNMKRIADSVKPVDIASEAEP